MMSCFQVCSLELEGDEIITVNNRGDEATADLSMEEIVKSQTLINFVRAQPCLWNNSHKDFKNKDLKTLTWESVGFNLKPPITGEYCLVLISKHYTIFRVMCSHVSQTNCYARITCFIFYYWKKVIISYVGLLFRFLCSF